MPSSTSSSPDAGQASTPAKHPLAAKAPFTVIPFRRAATGELVPGTLMELSNGELAWRCARAAASAPGNVGAVELRDGALLAQFGQVNLEALPH